MRKLIVAVCAVLAVALTSSRAVSQSLSFDQGGGGCTVSFDSDYINQRLVRPTFAPTDAISDAALIEILRIQDPSILKSAQREGQKLIAILPNVAAPNLAGKLRELESHASIAPRAELSESKASKIWMELIEQSATADGNSIGQAPNVWSNPPSVDNGSPLSLYVWNQPIHLTTESLTVGCSDLGIMPIGVLPDAGSEPSNVNNLFNPKAEWVQSVAPGSDVTRIPGRPPATLGGGTGPTDPDKVDWTAAEKAGYQRTSLVSGYDEYDPKHVDWAALSNETGQYLTACKTSLNLISRMIRSYDASSSGVDYRGKLDAHLNSSDNSTPFRRWQDVVLSFFSTCRTLLSAAPATSLRDWQKSSLEALRKSFVAVWRIEKLDGAPVLLGCSGYVVQNSGTVLTARHCVTRDGATKWNGELLPCSLAACAGLLVTPYSDTKSYEIASIEDFMTTAPQASQAGDLVLLRLKSPIVAPDLSPANFSPEVLAQGMRVVLAGIPSDFLHALWEKQTGGSGRIPPAEWVLQNWKSAVVVDHSPVCHVITPPGDRSCLTVSCASLPGMSGGPVIRAGTNLVIGAMSGAPGATEGQFCAQGTELISPRTNVVAVPSRLSALIAQKQ